MDKTLLIKSVFLFMSLWGFTIAFMWFRPRIEAFWKVIATLIFLFYLWFFWENLNSGYALFLQNWYTVIVDFIKETIALVFVNLFLFWPLSLIILFYKSDDIGAERLLRFMCILTLALWILFVAYVYYEKGIDSFFYEKLKEFIPDAR